VPNGREVGKSRRIKPICCQELRRLVNDYESQNPANQSQSFTTGQLLAAQHRLAQALGGFSAKAELLSV